jgi:Glycosyl transferases group 1
MFMNNVTRQYFIRRMKKYQASWDKIIFNLMLSEETNKKYDSILIQAEEAQSKYELHEDPTACAESTDPLVQQGALLKKEVENFFFNICKNKYKERILIQVPNPVYSPAGYSLFTSLVESLIFIGVPTEMLGWDDNTAEILNAFKPTVLLSSDHENYLNQINWNEVDDYRSRMELKIGLTASIEEYVNTPLKGRLAWAQHHRIDFYYSFRDANYIGSRSAYKPFFDAGYKILNVPFGANILHYFPVAGFERDLNYVLMATRKSEHMSYLKNLVHCGPGFIDGPGWRHVKNFKFNRQRDRFIYARAKLGLNVHLPEQLEWACEVNERTYQLAACGVPQLVDHPLLLTKVFSTDALFIGNSEREYTELFHYILAHPREAEKRAMKAQVEVFGQHTTFHRANALIAQLSQLKS